MKSFLVIFLLFVIDYGVQCTENGQNVTETPSESSKRMLNPTFTSSLADMHPDFSSPAQFDRFWKSIDRVLNSTDVQFHQIADQIAQTSAQLNQSSSQCYQLIEQAFRLGFHKQWSGKMINANTFYTNGFVNGLISDRYTSLGDFLGCISEDNITSTTANGETISFSGKYCLASLTTPKLGYYTRDVQAAKFSNLTNYLEDAASNWLNLRNRFPNALGVCAPSVCSQEELTTFIGKYFEPYLEGMDLEVAYCQVSNQPKKLRLGFIIALSIIVGTILTSILATLISKIVTRLQTSTAKVHPVSGKSRGSQSLLFKFIDCFNIEKNLRLLFKVDSKEKLARHAFDLRFVHGMKAVIMLSTVYVHTAAFFTILHFGKLSTFSRFPTFFYQMEEMFTIAHGSVVRGFMLVDVFFNMSGFLVTYTVLSKAKRVPNFFPYVFLRYLRLLPSVVAVICLTILLQKTGKGPMFHEDLTEPFVEPCYTYWWAHVLFVHNFLKAEKMCGPNLWFIAADWQLHILLYIVLFFYYRKKFAAYVTAFILVTGSLAGFFVFNYFGFPGWPRADFALRFHDEAPYESIRLYYTSPQAHVMAYILGAVIAMKLIQLRKAPTSSKLTDTLIMVIITGISVSLLYPIKFFDTEMNVEKSITFLAWFTLFFATTMALEALLFYCFVVSRNHFLKRILSTKFLVPIGRLTYGIYLLNPLVNWFSTLQNWDAQTLTIMMVTINFGAVYLQCFFLSIVLYVFFQSPIYNVVQVLMTHKVSSEKKSETATDNDQHLSMTDTSSHLMNRSERCSNGNGKQVKL